MYPSKTVVPGMIFQTQWLFRSLVGNIGLRGISPRLEGCFPQVEASFPQVEAWFPQVEGPFPQVEASFPQVEFAVKPTPISFAFSWSPTDTHIPRKRGRRRFLCGLGTRRHTSGAGLRAKYSVFK